MGTLFLDEFEEGMCDYLSRKLTLTEEEFKAISKVESTLMTVFQSEYNHLTLDDFGTQTHQASLSSIMYQYWRSFLTIKYLVEEQFNHDIHQVFTTYHEWDKGGRSIPLTEYFGITTNQ